MTTFKAFQRIVAALLPLLAALAFSVSPAGAEGLSPWWHSASSSRPSYLNPNAATNDVQRLTVSAKEGTYSLAGRSFTVGEEPEGVQATLERVYGQHAVEVTGGPGPEANNPYEVYEVKFVGKLTYQPVETIGVGASSVTGGRGAVEVAQVAKGRPAGLIVVTASNLGDGPVNPATRLVTVTDRLPAGLEAVGIEGAADEAVGTINNPLACSLAPEPHCTFTGKEGLYKTVGAYQPLQMRIAVKFSPEAQASFKAGTLGTFVNEAGIAGGGAPAVSAQQPLTVSEAPVPFAVNTFEMRPETAGGGIDTQAGSHPFQFTTTLNLNESFEDSPGGTRAGRPIALAKDLSFKLPPGLIGNPDAVAKCTLGQFVTEGKIGYTNECPNDTAIGVARVFVTVHGYLRP